MTNLVLAGDDNSSRFFILRINMLIKLFVFHAEVDTLELERLPMQGGLCIIIPVNTFIWTEDNLRLLNVNH